MIAQREIASKLGVSQTAISFVVNTPETKLVSAKKKKKILNYLKKISYQVPAKRTGNICYIISFKHRLSDLFFRRFFVGVVNRCQDLKLNVLVETLDGNFTPLILQNKVAGIIIEKPVTKEEVKNLLEHYPVVLLNFALDELVCDTVMPDNTGGISQAVSGLFAKGHRNIAFFGMEDLKRKDIHVTERQESYRLALQNHNLPVNEDYMKVFPAKTKTLEEIHQYLLNALTSWRSLPQPPTGVICMNDLYAISLIKVASSLRIKIPEDLSVIGFDNLEACNFTVPALDSINQHMEEMGKTSVDCLFYRIENGNDISPRKILCGTNLVERKSVKRV